MPIYTFECQNCKTRETVTAKVSDPAPVHCETAMQKVPVASGFALKGGGWYADGYRSKS